MGFEGIGLAIDGAEDSRMCFYPGIFRDSEKPDCQDSRKTLKRFVYGSRALFSRGESSGLDNLFPYHAIDNTRNIGG